MYVLLKSLFDKIFAAVVIILFLPIFFLTAICIKLTSKGPIFFKQKRLGLNCKPFTLYKFRTMYVTDIPQQDFVNKLIKGEYGEIGTNAIFKMKNDPRITPIGRVLRKMSLDEIPQFLNVLKGEMSLVGPRAPIPYEVEHYEEWHKERLRVKPGMTCLWQITHKDITTFDEMVRLDIEYAKKRSILLDLKILFKTLCVSFLSKGAY